MREEDILTPKIKEPDEIKKKVKVQYTGRQLILPIPAQFAEIVNLKKGDMFLFRVSIKNKKDFEIKWLKKK